DKTYHKMNSAKLKKIAPQIDWATYLLNIDAKKAGDLIVMQPDFFKEIAIMVDAISLSDWKTYLEWHLVNDFAGFLSPAFVKQSFAFYGTVLSGAKALKPLWRRTLSTVNGNLGEMLGKLYVEKHFGPEAKKRMNALVEDLFVAYEQRIKNLDWMSAPTKKKAIAKLHTMNHKIGYPDRWKSYKGLVIKADEYVGNVMRTALYEHRREMKKLEKPVDRKEWFMYPQTVNAYFSASLNEIVFPAAILQLPFFDLSADDAHNYGCIGTVIGHEMTHGFDDQGAKYDAKGNVKTWWTSEDKKRFEAKTKQLVMQFNQYKVADGVPVNGKLTLGENVADLGGLVIALDAYKNHLVKHPSVTIDGFSPLERFFVAFAVFEREICRPEFEKMHALNDPHSPGTFRINGPASNVDEFYETFGVTTGDKLYRTSTARAKIW
ncbi:MAG: M13 family metallopeptidase, partial [Minisyncoccia bacterium]